MSGAGNTQDEPGNLAVPNSKEVIKESVKGLRSQHVETPTSQIQGNLSFNKTMNGCL